MFFSLVVVCCSNFQDFTKSLFFQSGNIYNQTVKVREQIEEADQYSYERSSLQSLKAFEWLSLDHSSASDEHPRSPVRIPTSPTPRFQASKGSFCCCSLADEREKKKKARGTSAQRPRAVVSSPDNDGIFTSKTQTRRELLLALKSHNLCQRHTKCKIFPASRGAGFD